MPGKKAGINSKIFLKITPLIGAVGHFIGLIRTLMVGVGSLILQKKRGIISLMDLDEYIISIIHR